MQRICQGIGGAWSQLVWFGPTVPLFWPSSQDTMIAAIRQRGMVTIPEADDEEIPEEENPAELAEEQGEEEAMELDEAVEEPSKSSG